MSLKEKTGAFIEANFARETAFLAELVKVPSDNPPGDCAPIAARAKTLLEELGLTVEAHVVPEAVVAAAGMKSVTNLIVRKKFGEGPVVALNAHGDVVPPGAGWSQDPYGANIVETEHGPVMFGRGVAVSKSDFATYAFALLALIDAAKNGAAFKGTVELHFTFDEESGGDIGPHWLLEQKLSKPDYAIAAGFGYAVVTAHNGCLHLEVTVVGKQAHAAMPSTGHDALEAANGILSALYASREALTRQTSGVKGITSPTLNVGLIAGGINTNVVPDHVTFRLDRRMIPEENPAQVESDLRVLIENAARKFPGIRTEVRRILLALPLTEQKGFEKIVAAIEKHAKEELKVDVPSNGVPLYTDARHYSSQGIPAVLYGAGPRSILEANAHNADENLRLNDLKAATKIIALAVADLLA
ncbi:MAG TPA: M20/M25/M40 family metallo-hydrolase [Xanthobacteraceae bacterium]|nr:M20/M25/M40 family metallo-hydrolase [Xanthobacteraceae bacterium]